MKTSAFPLVARLSCIAVAWLALSAPARAADGINRLVLVAHLKAQTANEETVEAADKQKELLEKKKQLRAAQKQLEELTQHSEELAGQVAHASTIAKDVAAIVVLEQTAAADGLDAAERKSLAELVAAAQQHVADATTYSATAIANAEKQLEQKKAADKTQVEQHLESLRATAKAHRQTATALRALAKKLAAR